MKILHNEKDKALYCRELYDKIVEYPWQVEDGPYKKKRSSQANARLFAMLEQIAAAMWDRGEKHAPVIWLEYFKGEFLGKEIVTVGGDPKVITQSSSSLNTQEFSDFSMEVEAWAGQNGIQLELL